MVYNVIVIREVIFMVYNVIEVREVVLILHTVMICIVIREVDVYTYRKGHHLKDILGLFQGITKVVVFVYQNMDELMTTKHNTSFINSNILSASIMSVNSVSLRKPVTFTLRLFQVRVIEV